MRAGLEPDDPEAHFIHSIAALAAHLDQEAEDAMVRCADASNSWDRPTRTRQLTRLMAVRPNLTDGLMRLRQAFVARWDTTRVRP